jgi:hypothetical protein
MSSRHSSVIREIVSWDTSMPIVRWQCRAISRTLIPAACKLVTVPLMPEVRRSPLPASTGSNVPARSRGTASVTGPASVFSVLARNPFRPLAPSPAAR